MRFVCFPVAQSYLTLCDPTDCNTPGFTVRHQLPELRLCIPNPVRLLRVNRKVIVLSLLSDLSSVHISQEAICDSFLFHKSPLSCCFAQNEAIESQEPFSVKCTNLSPSLPRAFIRQHLAWAFSRLSPKLKCAEAFLLSFPQVAHGLCMLPVGLPHCSHWSCTSFLSLP